jgi:hypothetical protein
MMRYLTMKQQTLAMVADREAAFANYREPT